NFGLKVGVVSSFRYEGRIRELVAGFPRLAAIVEPLLTSAGSCAGSWPSCTRCWWRRSAAIGVPAADDRPTGRRCGSVDLPGDGRPPATFPPFPGGRRACRPDAEALPVWRDRL